jgi:hypothetical protein
MAYLVTDRYGRREFRWLVDGQRRSRRIPRGGNGDRLLAELSAVHETEAEMKKVRRAEITASVAEVRAMCRDLDILHAAVRARLNETLEPPLVYDHIHGTIVRTDRMNREKIKAAAKSEPKPKRVGWIEEGQPIGMDPTCALRSRLASKFWPNDLARQMAFFRNLQEIEAELLDGDGSLAARMLVGNLVLTWVHSLWADNELVWETHRVGVAPAATVAMTRRAESLSRRFQSELRLWESYCRRTRGEITEFRTHVGNRISQYLAERN